MTNADINPDSLTIAGTTREIFNPDSKGTWPDAGSRVYVSVHRVGPEGLVQLGYDPDSGKSYARAAASGESRWSSWTVLEAPPPPPEGGEGETRREDEGGDAKAGKSKR